MGSVYDFGGSLPVVGPPICFANMIAFGDWLASSVHTALAFPSTSMVTLMKSARSRLPPKTLQLMPRLQMSPMCITCVLIWPTDQRGVPASALRDWPKKMFHWFDGSLTSVPDVP